MAKLPDRPMEHLLESARRMSNDSFTKRASSDSFAKRVSTDSITNGNSETRRASTQADMLKWQEDRRLSEAGVSRRGSSGCVYLNHDTDSLMVGMRVFVDGFKPGRIQYIGDAKFGPGDWAGVVLDEAVGKNDGSVSGRRYFQCEKNRGVFSRLFRLTLEPIEGADEQYRDFLADLSRRGSVAGSENGFSSRRSSTAQDRRGSWGSDRRGSVASPLRGNTPEPRRGSVGPRSSESPESEYSANGRRSSASPASGGVKKHFSRSPLASPSSSRSNVYHSRRIELDPEINVLTSEAKRLSLGGARRQSGPAEEMASQMRATRGLANGKRHSNSNFDDHSHSNGRPATDHEAELQNRKLSEAGLRRASATQIVLNENTERLMVGHTVWVDGTKEGRIAYIGEVKFSPGEWAGVALKKPLGKNDGSVGGVHYFQCDPGHGLFSKLFRLTAEPLVEEINEDEYDY